MTFQLAEFLSLGNEWTFAVLLVFLRVGSAMAILPAVGEKSVPQKIRLVITLVFTLIVATAVQPMMIETQYTKSELALVLTAEVVIGLAIGFSLRAFIFTLQIASSIIAQSTSLSQVFGGAVADPQPAIGHLLLAAGLALAVTYGLHVQIAEFLIYSYEILPPGFHSIPSEFSAWGLAQISMAFGLAFSMAAPFVLASLIYNIALGAINKAMPQLMVSFVGAPAITAGGLILLVVCAPIMLAVWHNAMLHFLEFPFQAQR